MLDAQVQDKFIALIFARLLILELRLLRRELVAYREQPR
jgi:hypothetical protein